MTGFSGSSSGVASSGVASSGVASSGVASSEVAQFRGVRLASSPVLEVLQGGLETTVQDYPGRRGQLQLGIPRSGPMDPRSFQLGNQLLNNPPEAAGLELQFVGPKLRFCRQTAIAISGANNHPQLNQKAIPLWTVVAVQPGDVLSFGHATAGARSYVQVAGGLDLPLVMGSRSTFLRGQLGGVAGRRLEKGDRLSSFEPLSAVELGATIPAGQRPWFSNQWNIEVLLGPHDDWLSGADIERFVTADWRVSSKSDRVGYRLEGPEFGFCDMARHKSPGNGEHPSNKIDYGCHYGTVLFCGQQPTILMVDAPSLTGYMAPFTVCRTSLWKVGQARPGDSLRFRVIDPASALRRQSRWRWD